MTFLLQIDKESKSKKNHFFFLGGGGGGGGRGGCGGGKWIKCTNVSNGMFTLQGIQMCQIILKYMLK